MRHIKLDLNNEAQIEKASKIAAEVLKGGGVIVYPTETLYGIGANVLDENAIIKVYKIKKQDRNKPISVIARDIKMARKIACIDFKTEKTLNKTWPGPITAVLRKKDIVPYTLTGNGETIAVRISNGEFASALMEKLDFPITATSANISGEKDLLKPSEIMEKFAKNEIAPDLFIDSGEIKNPMSSTIVDLTAGAPKILRAGIMGKEKIKEFFGKFVE